MTKSHILRAKLSVLSQKLFTNTIYIHTDDDGFRRRGTGTEHLAPGHFLHYASGISHIFVKARKEIGMFQKDSHFILNNVSCTASDRQKIQSHWVPRIPTPTLLQSPATSQLPLQDTPLGGNRCCGEQLVAWALRAGVFSTVTPSSPSRERRLGASEGAERGSCRQGFGRACL